MVRTATALALGGVALLRGATPTATAPAPAPAAWTSARPGVERAVLRRTLPGMALPLDVHLVRIDPAQVRLELAANVDATGRVRPWTADDAPAEAVAAFNAGQFGEAGPWGWVVHRGREHRPPGTGELAMAVVVGSDGRVDLVEADRIPAVRASGRAVEAIQSYPALLVGRGELPAPLRHDGLGVDRRHRDGRLAIGQFPDGRILLALTRVAGVAAATPIGPTVPEMAELMRQLGCERAVMLDGGLSSQLLVRGAAAAHWPGLRSVPLGVAAFPREGARARGPDLPSGSGGP